MWQPDISVFENVAETKKIDKKTNNARDKLKSPLNDISRGSYRVVILINRTNESLFALSNRKSCNGTAQLGFGGKILIEYGKTYNFN